jgi:hypothetical protein
VLDLYGVASEVESEAGAGGGAAAVDADEGGDAAGGDAAEGGLVGEEEGLRAALRAELWAELEEERAAAARLGSALQPLPPPPEELDEFGGVEYWPTSMRAAVGEGSAPHAALPQEERGGRGREGEEGEAEVEEEEGLVSGSADDDAPRVLGSTARGSISWRPALDATKVSREPTASARQLDARLRKDRRRFEPPAWRQELDREWRWQRLDRQIKRRDGNDRRRDAATRATAMEDTRKAELERQLTDSHGHARMAGARRRRPVPLPLPEPERQSRLPALVKDPGVQPVSGEGPGEEPGLELRLPAAATAEALVEIALQQQADEEAGTGLPGAAPGRGKEPTKDECIAELERRLAAAEQAALSRDRLPESLLEGFASPAKRGKQKAKAREPPPWKKWNKAYLAPLAKPQTQIIRARAVRHSAALDVAVGGAASEYKVAPFQYGAQQVHEEKQRFDTLAKGAARETRARAQQILAAERAAKGPRPGQFARRSHQLAGRARERRRDTSRLRPA